MTHIGRLQGLWRRSMIAWPDGRSDTTTQVDWLQGPSLYVDLRQPVGQLHFDRVSCLRDLAPGQAAAMAAQEGFAGTLVQHADHFEWTRLIDFQPSPLGDRGILVERDGMLVEDGYSTAYREHWHREPETATSAAMSMRDDRSGCSAILVRGGDRFMYARSRPPMAETGRSLTESVCNARSPIVAQDLVDCEISFGLVTDLWTIARSTMPWRVGASLDLNRSGDRIVTADVTPDGQTLQRVWSICAAQHDIFNPAAPPPARALEA